jgi:hypothetical protein
MEEFPWYPRCQEKKSRGIEEFLPYPEFILAHPRFFPIWCSRGDCGPRSACLMFQAENDVIFLGKGQWALIDPDGILMESQV